MNIRNLTRLALVTLPLLAAAQPASAESGLGAFGHAPRASVDELDRSVGRLLLPDGSEVHFTLALTQAVNGTTTGSLTLSSLDGYSGRGTTVPQQLDPQTFNGLIALLPGTVNNLDNVTIENLTSLTIDYRPAARSDLLASGIVSGLIHGLSR